MYYLLYNHDLLRFWGPLVGGRREDLNQTGKLWHLSQLFQEKEKNTIKNAYKTK